MEIRCNGTTLYAEQAGGGPAMVFVHGMCGDSRVWNDQVRRLSDRFHCTTYDRRGHTRSPGTDAIETVELHADDLAGLIEALDLAPCVVVGSSGGARITVDLIRRYPGLVRGAAVSEPPIGAIAPEEFAALIGEVASGVKQAAETDGPEAAVDVFFIAVCPGLWSTISEDVKNRYRRNAPALLAEFSMVPYRIAEEDAASIETPVLVMTGTRSHDAFQTIARTLARWLPDARLAELDCGHVTYAECPEEFAFAVAEFASEVQSVS